MFYRSALLSLVLLLLVHPVSATTGLKAGSPVSSGTNTCPLTASATSESKKKKPGDEESSPEDDCDE